MFSTYRDLYGRLSEICFRKEEETLPINPLLGAEELNVVFSMTFESEPSPNVLRTPFGHRLKVKGPFREGTLITHAVAHLSLSPFLPFRLFFPMSASAAAAASHGRSASL